ncbi:hypothetical protein COOONC_27269 [Cooperia oncophora]
MRIAAPEDHPESFAEVRIVVHLRGSPICVRDVGSPAPRSPPRRQSPQGERKLIDPSIVCFFCEANHYTANCTTIKSLTDYAIRLAVFAIQMNITQHSVLIVTFSFAIGPDVKTFFKAMYFLYENYYIRHPKP